MDMKDYFNGDDGNKYTYVKPYMRRYKPYKRIRLDRILLTMFVLGIVAIPFIINPKLLLTIFIPIILIMTIIFIGKRKRIINKIKMWLNGSL
jgi:ABC-type multidrug transport system fused ATPase/permease subunit